VLYIVEHKMYWISAPAGFEVHAALAAVHRSCFVRVLFHARNVFIVQLVCS
jgi:hypothetical protein